MDLKMDNVQSFFSQKVCCLLCTISAKDHKAVQAEFIISLLHCFNLVQAILIRDTHQFEWLSGCSEDCAALCKDSGKIFGGNGTQKTENLLREEGLNIIHLPKTIDNDIYGTDMTFGFQSAVTFLISYGISGIRMISAPPATPA